ncbi:hypothetical protein [Actinocorallia longicatena]|uniref:Integral membrane protein n=1 Tax=Actinocorallia longicatena TaxID=111803 RepID=A0ABP6Q5M3_9ACTN
MSNRPRTLLAAALLEGLLGLGALGFGLYVAFESVLGEPKDRMSAVGVTVLALAGGAGMVWVAKGLAGAERWSRSPAVLTQLFAIPVAVSLIQSDQPFWGCPLVVIAVAALLALLSPPTSAALYDEGDSEESPA